MPYAELRISIANGLQNEVMIFDNPLDCWENGLHKLREIKEGLYCVDCEKIHEKWWGDDKFDNLYRLFYTRNGEPWLEMELEYFPN